MIGIMLAAGKGSRLGNLTNDTPKSLLKLDEKRTLLDYNLEVLNRLGVNKILIVTGFCSEKIDLHVRGMDNIECVYNPFWNCCNVLGSLYMALPYVNDDFLFLHADTLVGYDAWEALVEYSGEIVMPYKRKICGEEEMKVLLDVNGSLLEVNKTMNPVIANGEFLGIAKFSSSIIDYLSKQTKNLFKNGRLDYYMEAVVEKAIIDSREVKAFDIGETKFVEVDFEEDYAMAKQIF